ncbi:hypothetical protein PCANC_12236 [Puccinia coronata f. sp. avenae]|uniref:Uncharacterized protein n=1 Tax=Puccinia coronata f. sp. avenae TaxID=200324 RepID=A0A2N5UAB6_9BASI|nr:hypothetical protein PCANC_12236 [Puccinia coronata f. sp. avenae]
MAMPTHHLRLHSLPTHHIHPFPTHHTHLLPTHHSAPLPTNDSAPLPINNGPPGGGMPEGTDPFAAISAAMADRFIRPLSKSTIALLAIFLIFHLLIAAFSLLILIAPFIGGKKRSHWLFRKLYIPSKPGEKARKTSLFMMNTGLFMCMAQLAGSLSTVGFIFPQFNTNRSVKYAIHAQPLIPLGLMYLFEMLAYWIMAHCFLALSYSTTTISTKVGSNRLSRWDPPPILVNAVFTFVPLCIIAGIIGTIIHGSAGYDLVMSTIEKTVEILSQGSSDLKRLALPSESDVQKNLIQSDLAQIQSELNVVGQESMTNLNDAIHFHHWSQIVYCVFMCVTCLVFSFSFMKLTQKLLLQGQDFSSPPTPKSPQLNRSESKDAEIPQDFKSSSRTPIRTYVGALRSNRQLLGFTVRAYATIIAMLTSMVFYLINISRTADVMTNPTWHGVVTWLPTVSGSWSAIPVAWQCWRLHSD